MMGWTWEVAAWMKAGNGQGYTYITVYTGESLIAVWRAARKAVRQGSGCIKIEWRPRS